MQIERNGRDERETTVVEAMLKVPCAGELLGAAVGLVRAADSNSRTNEGTFALLIKAFSLLKQFAEAVCSADTVGETEAEMTQAELLKSKLPEAVEKSMPRSTGLFRIAAAAPHRADERRIMMFAASSMRRRKFARQNFALSKAF